MEVRLPDLSYDCIACGKSCTAFEVEVQPEEASALQTRRTDGGRFFLLKQESGRCVHLSADTRCQVHSHKPRTCRDFPLTAQPTPDGVFVGLSFLCTAVAQGAGPPMESHRALLQARYGGAQEAPDRWPLWDDWALDWPTYLQVEGYLQQHGALVTATRLARAVAARDPGQLRLDTPADPALRARLALELLTLMETAGQGPETIQGVLEALQTGRSYASRLFGREVRLERPEFVPEWLRVELDRYLGHLLFRKTLLEPPDVLSRVCLLALLEEVLLSLTGPGSERADWERAVGLVEGRLMLHTRGLDSFFRYLARQFLAAGNPDQAANPAE